MKLLGTIEQAGPWLALRTSPTCVYPLGGASGIADDFREAFGDAQAHDIGKRVYRHSAGHLCMENDEQREARHKHDADNNPDWKPRVAYRIYACEKCATETTIQTNHTGSCFSRCMGKCRNILNPHTAHERVLPADTRHVYISEKYI